MVLPAWAAQIGYSEQQFQEMCSEARHPNHILGQLMFYAEHPATMFDATFYRREPLLEVRLDADYAHNLFIGMVGDDARAIACLKAVRLSTGTCVHMNEIWGLFYMPPNIDIRDIDLGKGEEIAGAHGETTRQMISAMYHCRSRAEEDFFLARWIAS